MIKDIEYFVKRIFFSKKFLLKRKLERQINDNYEKELSIIKNFENINKIAIDVGVYRGLYTYKLSKHFKKVISFEPNPLIFDDLNKNLKKLSNNIEIYNYALSDNDGFAKLKIPNRGASLFNKNYEEIYKLGAATIHKTNNLSNCKSFDVKKKKLDNLIDNSLEIGFIKIDVEGHESEVIDGASNIITLNKPVLLIEIEEKHTKKPITQTINKIKNLGYNCYQLKKNEISKFDLKNHNINDNNFIFISD
tara:strand:- start:8456 stop:9202 length:747 start_codon:yes stop_codon:yes gene_type:complete